MQLSRKEFLRLMAAGLGPLISSAWLQGCAPPPTPSSTPIPPTAVPTSPPPTATSPPTATIAPTATPVPQVVVLPNGIRRPGIIQMYPTAPSTVVHTHHAGVWSSKQLAPKAIREMLDASITKLTGLKDAKAAWQALFRPDEQIAIKVNAFTNSIIWTHVPLVEQVTASLVDAGIPAEKIVVFDYTSDELKTAGFHINPSGAGVRCYGTETDYAAEIRLENGVRVQLSNVLKKADAVINMPVLKSHMIAGLTFALKNHYGSVVYPAGLHSVDNSLPGLNALPDIKDKTRLVIGDILEACLAHEARYPYWRSDYVGDSILMSYDPLAHDRVGMDIFKQLKADQGQDSTSQEGMSQGWFANAGTTGLGANDPKNIKLEEIKLG